MRRVSWLCDAASGYLLLAICVLNCVAVFQRYVMLDAISWSEEAIRYLAIWMTFFGAAAASWLDEHMDMNLLADYGNPYFQKWHKASLQLLTAIFGVIVLWQGVIYVKLNGMQTSPSLGLPMVYVYSGIAVGGLLTLLISIVKIYDCFVPPAVVEQGVKPVI